MGSLTLRPSRPGLVRACALFLCLGLVVGACSGTPSEEPESDPGARVERALADVLDAGGDLANLKAVLVAVDGQTLVEKYYNTSRDQHFAVQSVTKSVMSALVGIAVEEGALDLESPLGELLPDRRQQMSAEVRAATLRDLLTMSAGFAESDTPEE